MTKIITLLLICSAHANAVTVRLDLHYDQVILRNQKKLSEVTLRSYNTKDSSVTIVSGRSISVVGINLFPENIVEDINGILPSEDELLALQEKEKKNEEQRQESERIRREEAMERARIVETQAEIARSTQEIEKKRVKEQKDALTSQSLSMAKQKAEQYYKFEHRIGRNNVLIVDDSLILNPPRYYVGPFGKGHFVEIRGQVGLQYFDSDSKKFKRFVAEFEVNTRIDDKGNMIIHSFQHIKDNIK